MGPVIRDNRRIDPVTGQPKRGKHAASQPAGTASAGRPGGVGPAKHRGDDPVPAVPAAAAPKNPAQSAGTQATQATEPAGAQVA